MEESEKRRERLRAMRMEADGGSTSTSSPSSTTLSNPLLDGPQENPNSSSSSRFGFYTDPMAAFSSDKRRTGPAHFAPRPHFSPGPKNPETPIYGVHQFQNSPSPGSYYSPRHATSPIGIRSPYSMHQGSPNFNCAPGRDHQFNNSPTPGPVRGGSPYPVHQGSPNFRSPPPGRGCWYNQSPSHSPGTGPGWGCRGGASPGIGRGRGRWNGSSMGSGSRHSGGRGRGYNFDGRSRSFYDKSMVEDPWESLTPVVWKGDNSAWSNFMNRGSLQKTPIPKKPRVSVPFNTSNSKQSLAEYLAASFDEAVGDAGGS